MDTRSDYPVLTVAGITQLANDVTLLRFKEMIPYKAGQYITFVFHDGEDSVRRSYSIASAPELDEPLQVAVKRIDNGLISRKLTDSVTPGTVLAYAGTGGLFVLPEDLTGVRNLVFFAAGSGIVPIFSLIKAALHSSDLSLLLVYSNSHPDKALFYNELMEWQQRFPERLHLEFLFSNTADLYRAHLHAGLIESFLKEHLPDSHTKALYYCCGPESYMRLCTYTLRNLQVPAVAIRREVFHTRYTLKKTGSPDPETREVRLIRGDQTYTIPVAPNESILQAARKKGVLLPYSCEAGRCGNCIAKVIEGTVWMSYNEVLTDTEINKGYILTCTGHPVGGNAVINS
ncbi:MAG TPA: iron-sulfur cluster-binding domain-containing protein [Flavisolibacter sp.]|jgi:ring-1,2-phenylacetyl-CoA epoxidase subunit PaaE|nr:iron-sulfur cluster-binding domain-containing protein [Flavisolibacter sp.]